MRIGIAEDQSLVRESLAIVLGLEADVEVRWTAMNGVEAVEQALALPVDVILMDLRMPGMDGVSAIKRIKEHQVDTDILVLTTFQQDEWLLDALHAGAKACFIKEIHPKLLLEAIRAIRTGTWKPEKWSDQWRLYAPEVQFQSRVSSGFGTENEWLTGREREILRFICSGLTNAQIAQKLFLTEGTVKNYVSTLFTKLGVRNRTEAARVALERGL